MNNVYFTNSAITPLVRIEVDLSNSFENVMSDILDMAFLIYNIVYENCPFLFMYPIIYEDGTEGLKYCEVMPSSRLPRPGFRFTTVNVDSLAALRVEYPLAGTAEVPFVLGRRAPQVLTE